MNRRTDLAPFLSHLAARRLSGLSPADLAPDAQVLAGAVLWADLADFTRLTERLSLAGAGGAERLSELLEQTYALVLGEVEATGGDLQFFAGDGALVLWPEPAPGALPAAVAQAHAAACGLAARLAELRPREGPLLMRSAVSAGALREAIVGGVSGRWCHLIEGEAVRQAGLAVAGAEPGRVALSGDAGRMLAAAQLAAPGPSPLPETSLSLDPATLECFLLPPLAAALRAQRGALLAEFRSLSVVFLSLSGLGWDIPLSTLQPAVTSLQRLLDDHGGLLYQLVQDDTGTTAVAAFGLPGASHDDDAVRAVRFARAARTALSAGDPAAPALRAAVATGPVFCAVCGTASRRQFSLFGSPLNRAARLMAAAGDDLLIDQPTFTQAERRLTFSPGARLALKGFGDPLIAFRGGEVRQGPASAGQLVGRETERMALESALRAVARGQPAAVVLEGPPGIGKTALLHDVGRICERLGLPLAFAGGDPLDSRTPYAGVRPLVRRLLGLDGLTAPAEAAALGERLAAAGELPDLLPLLNPFLAQPLEDTPLTRQLVGSLRAENRTRLVAVLLAAATRVRPPVLVVDDGHWLDGASWSLLTALKQAAPGLSWVLATRPPPARPEALRALMAGGTWIRPSDLPPEAVEALLSRLWDVRQIDPGLLDLLIDRTEGNPLFCQELARSLLAAGQVRIVNGCCQPAPGFDPRTARALPLTYAALVRSRLDQLGPGTLTALKAASVLGLEFEPALVESVLADIGETRAEPGRIEADLLAAGEGVVHRPPVRERLQFAHASVQAVTYEMLPERQRRAMHGAAGRALERLHGGELTGVAARLAHHYSEADVLDRAAAFSAAAAEQALESYANEDAVHLYQRALRLDERYRPEKTGDLRRARWYAGLAQAHYSLTQPPETRAAFACALAEAGVTEPVGVGRLLRGLLGFLIRRALPRASRPLGGERRERAAMAVALLPEWAALDVWEGRLIDGAARFFTAYLLAERVLPSGDAAHAIGGTGYLLGMTPLRALGEREVERAVRLADDSGDLKARASTRVTAGMYHTVMGAPARALPLLLAAQAPAEQLGAGLWKHRSRFQLAEPLFMLGRYREAGAVFRQAAALASGAEPPIIGLATCLAALAEVRAGDAAAGLALIDGPQGLALFSGRYLPLQRFTAVGARIDALLRLRRMSEAASLAATAEQMAADPACDVFFAGLHGHGAVAEAYLRTGDLAAAGRACARLRRFAKLYPAARPRSLLMTGWLALLSGRPRRARRLLAAAIRLAERMQSPWEAERARDLLAPVSGNA